MGNLLSNFVFFISIAFVSYPQHTDVLKNIISDGEYVGLERSPDNYTPEDRDATWFHENTLVIRNNEAILDKVPITIHNGRKTYSASDGGFTTYRAKFIIKNGKSLVALRLCRSDYVLFPINKPDPYAEIKTLPVKLVSDRIVIDGVQYRRTVLDKTSLNFLLRELKTEPLEKTNAKR
ncbi:MAG TPA: hypothetical protein VMC85_07880 [Desulfomonilaceae bacterium]|nr:hypothetical protein [Desulfomonilaceae bacterium]